MQITGKNVLDAWKKCLSEIIENGEEHLDDKSKAVKEILNMQIEVQDASDLDKVFEILNSLGNFAFPPKEELKNFILSRRSIPGYYYNYGARAFNFNGTNQIDDYIIPMLKSNCSSKRAVVVFYNPKEDSHLERKDTPGMIMIDFKIRNGKLDVTSIIRSNNMLYGWPANVYQSFLLQEYISQELKVKPGKITTFSTSAHLIEEDLEYAGRIVGK